MLNRTEVLALHLLVLEHPAAFTTDNLFRALTTLDANLTFHAILPLICKSEQIPNVIAKLRPAMSNLATAARLNVNVVSCLDPLYPTRLKKISNPPLVLFVKGDVGTLNCDRSVAVVGSRDATENAKRFAFTFAKEIIDQGTSIVSGLAVGCDTAAHNAALACATGKTIAVLAHGLDKVYPAENQTLANRIVAGHGCLVSIYPFGVSPNKDRFYDRNGIQTGLSDATVIVQAAKVRCGTMATAAHCRAQRRILFCMDHTKFDAHNAAKYKGNTNLISGGVREITPANIHNFSRDLEALLHNTLPMVFRSPDSKRARPSEPRPAPETPPKRAKPAAAAFSA